MAPRPADIRDLGTSATDRDLLRAFYTDLYVPAFPDADERESLANIERYLELKATGWYGRNNYHVRVWVHEGRLIGGVIADYLAGPNTGVIEFLVLAPEQRGQNLGHRLLDDVEAALDADARAAGAPRIRAVAAEMNDPFRSSLAVDSMDPFERVRIWSGWGYAKLDFPYVQPALSEGQRPVSAMLLAWKGMADQGEAVPAPIVKDVVHEYLRWAMRIEEPSGSAEFAGMARYLDGCERVALIPLDAYVGHDRGRPLDIREITAADPDLPAACALYAVHFEGATAIDPASLGRATERARGHDHVYHLWAVRAAPGAPLTGLASFFTLPEAGFGGYVVLAPPLRGTGRLALLLARMETQMRRDGLGATGWFIECDDPVVARFQQAGFRELAIPYRQPALRPGGPAPVLHLLYKDFGRAYAPPALDGATVRAALRRIHTVVYGIDRPDEDPVCRTVVDSIVAGVVPLR